MANKVGACAPLGVDGALLRNAPPYTHYTRAHQALATTISRRKSCSDARYPQVALMQKIRQPEFLTAPDADVTREDSQYTWSDPRRGHTANKAGACAPLGGDEAPFRIAPPYPGGTLAHRRPWPRASRDPGPSATRSICWSRSWRRSDNQPDGMHPTPLSHLRGSQKTLPDPTRRCYCKQSWGLRAPGH